MAQRTDRSGTAGRKTAQKKTAAQRASSGVTAGKKPAGRNTGSRTTAGRTAAQQTSAPHLTERQAAIQRQTDAHAPVRGYRRRKKKSRVPQLAALCAVVLIAGAVVLAAFRSKPEAEKLPAETGSETESELAGAETGEETEETIDRSQVVVGDDVLAKESTPNSGGYNRTINLDLACKAIDGTLLLADEVFSFNETVGERTEEKGYLPASIYTSGTVSDEVGGGICQVASTLYLTAMEADFEILDRCAHQFTVSYMPLGMDASIYWGSQDLKFRNTSGNPVRIYASTDGYTVDISIVGTKKDDTYVTIEYEIIGTYEPEEEERIDWMEDPGYSEVVSTPITGYYVQTYRCHYSADGTLLSRTKEAISNYNKRNRVTVVGPPATEAEQPTEPEETEPQPTAEEVPTEPAIDG